MANTTKANFLPVLVGILAFAGSLAIVALTWFKILGAEAAIIGWLLTPIGVFLCLIWDFQWQRMGSRNRNFSPRRSYSTALRVLAYASLAVTGFHAWVLADFWSGY